jgi:hypothetical protein
MSSAGFQGTDVGVPLTRFKRVAEMVCISDAINSTWEHRFKKYPVLRIAAASPTSRMTTKGIQIAIRSTSSWNSPLSSFGCTEVHLATELRNAALNSLQDLFATPRASAPVRLRQRETMAEPRKGPYLHFYCSSTAITLGCGTTMTDMYSRGRRGDH